MMKQLYDFPRALSNRTLDALSRPALLRHLPVQGGAQHMPGIPKLDDSSRSWSVPGLFPSLCFGGVAIRFSRHRAEIVSMCNMW